MPVSVMRRLWLQRRLWLPRRLWLQRRLRRALPGVIALSLAACQGKTAQADSTTPTVGSAAPDDRAVALPVAGEAVRRGDLVLTVATTGQVKAAAVSHLKAETAGTVDEVLVHPGSVVHKGDLLVRLDPRPFDLAVREANAALEEAQIRYRGNLASDSILLGPGGEAERNHNAMTLSGVPAAQVRLERAELDREQARIVAPFDGVLDEVEVAAGERLSPGQAVATVVDVAHLRVEAQVLEHDLAAVRSGGDAWISTPARGSAALRGRIASVLPLVDTTARAGRVIVEVGNSGATLRPGMYTDLRLEANRLPNRILVPSRAVIERDGRPLVFVAKGGRAQWVYINPGSSNGVDTEVLPDSGSGTIPVVIGDTVLVEGHLTLTHDAPIRVVSAAERP